MTKSTKQKQFECMGTYKERNNTAYATPTNPDCQVCGDVERCYAASSEPESMTCGELCVMAKGAKLRHYASRDPKEFIQIDGFYLPGGCDSVMVTDNDGDCIQAGKTIELMNGADVRILIRDPRGEHGTETNKADIKRLLEKISSDIDWALQNDYGDKMFGDHKTVLLQTIGRDPGSVEEEEQEYDCPIHGHEWCACGRAGTGKDGVK